MFPEAGSIQCHNQSVFYSKYYFKPSNSPFVAYVMQELCDVGTWLHSLELQGYQELFEAAGYKTRDDLENLKGLKRMDLQKMGISKRGRNKKNHSLVTSHPLPLAHLHRFEEGILRLSYLYDAKFRLMPEFVTWLEQHDCTVSLI